MTVPHYIGCRLEQVVWHSRTKAWVTAFADLVADWKEADPRDHKNRRVQAVSLEFDPSDVLSGKTALGAVRAFQFAQRIRERLGWLLGMVPYCRHDADQGWGVIPDHYFLAVTPSTFFEGARQRGMSAHVVYPSKTTPRVVSFQQRTGRIPIPYASYLRDRRTHPSGFEFTVATSSLLDQRLTLRPVLHFLCDLADAIDEPRVALAQKWHDCDPETLEPVWPEYQGLSPLHSFHAWAPGTCVDLWNGPTVAQLRERGKIASAQRYPPTDVYSLPETLEVIHYGSAPSSVVPPARPPNEA